MTGTVLSTPEAKEAIRKMQQIINGPLLDQINALDREGQMLSNPKVWEGRLAQQFRNEWPQMKSALKKAQDAIEQLRKRAQQINQDIMTAGGN